MKNTATCAFRLFLLFCLGFLSFDTFAQQANDAGELHGNFQLDANITTEILLIGAPVVPEKVLTNGFMNLWYTRGEFSAGLRYESYLNVMQGLTRATKEPNPFRFAL
ncbi:MAG: DUF6029 family protein [Bacteroidia bacterium]